MSLSEQQEHALCWVLAEACELSHERLHGLKLDDARREVSDLASLADLLPSTALAELVRSAVAGLHSQLPSS